MNRSDLSFLEPMFNKPVSQIKFNILVVNQSAAGNLRSDYDNITVLNDPVYGLSRSRNTALKQGNKALCWFLDDDVVIASDAVTSIIAAFNKGNDDVLKIFKIANVEGFPFRAYNSSLKVPKRPVQLRGMCSIELVVNRMQVLKTGVLFREDLGLGTDMPTGEEFVFVAQLLQQQAVITFEQAVIAKHDAHHSGLALMDQPMLTARGFIYGLVYPKTKKFHIVKYLVFLLRKGFIKSIKQFIITHKLLTSRV